MVGLKLDNKGIKEVTSDPPSAGKQCNEQNNWELRS